MMEKDKFTVEATIKTGFDKENKTLSFETFYQGITTHIVKEMLDFKEQKTKEALIALGWTPPREGR